MRDITITANDAGRRLDRFLRKYLRNASLGEIYKLIRKDVKVDGKRRGESYMLSEGEVLTLYISDEALDKLTGSSGPDGRSSAGTRKAKRQFRIIYEDSNILIADKPFGLLTHGDRHEKKNHLANQVRDYLIERGEFDPRTEKVFSPAPANRLDRNTTGLVLFGKNAAALRALGEVIRNDLADKFYLTIACGTIDRRLTLTGLLAKDEQANKVEILPGSQDAAGDADTKARSVVTIAEPLRTLSFGAGLDATLTEIQLVTGRSHQIRAHLASTGHPVAGDVKYADAGASALNRYLRQKYHLSTQLLHAYRFTFASEELPAELAYLSGKSFTAPLPSAFSRILADAGVDTSAVLRGH